MNRIWNQRKLLEEGGGRRLLKRWALKFLIRKKKKPPLSAYLYSSEIFPIPQRLQFGGGGGGWALVE